jgi:hypothetical protein
MEYSPAVEAVKLSPARPVRENVSAPVEVRSCVRDADCGSPSVPVIGRAFAGAQGALSTASATGVDLPGSVDPPMCRQM